jgi:hypothetical protein
MLRKAFFAAAAAALTLVSSASAATITYTLNLSVPGTFTLSATTSAGDNAGLAAFGIPLTGTVTSLDNVAPSLTVGQKGSYTGAVGFTSLRSGDSASQLVDPLITGSQDAVNAAAPGNLVYGIGQSVGSFATSGFTPLFAGTDPQAWVSPVVLATGTYTGSLGFALQSPNLAGNAFTASGGAAAPSATIATQIISIPEPATLSLLGLALVGSLGMIRRRHAA